MEDKKKRFLSATFADLAASDLPWEEMPPAPVPRLDGAAVQIKNLLYVFAGYGSIDYVSSLFFFFFSQERKKKKKNLLL